MMLSFINDPARENLFSEISFFQQKETEMKKRTNRRSQPTVSSPSGGKKKWQEPKLSFVKPKLTKHGKLEEVTGQFFGPFSPPPTNG
jgi:hypothetical protein